MSTVKKLTKMKEALDTAKEQRSEAQGELNALKKRLKKEHGITTVEEARSKLKKLMKEEDRLNTELEELIEELEKAHDWE